jgi:hypothetical protein
MTDRENIVFAQLGIVTVSYDKETPLQPTISPYRVAIEATAYECLTILINSLASRTFEPPVREDRAWELDSLILKQLVELRRMHLSETSNAIVGHYQRIPRRI